MRRVALAVFILSMLATLWFGLRSYGSFQLLRSAYAAGAPKTSSIRPWMTITFVAVTYRISTVALIERLGLPPGTDPNTSLKSLAERVGLSSYQYTQYVQRAVADLVSSDGSDRTSETSGWLKLVGDKVLTALLVYGYPVLALTLLLGAIGLPLPDGLATTVAGSLAAQGRMNWVLAAIIIVTASVLGDVVGYGLGRLLGREVLERYGRWLGYTPARHARVQLLFDRWGSLTVFITRTFVSYLSSIASLMAGVSHYRLIKFLAIAMLGRVMWTSAYLGLGYSIGGDLEAATAFLTNLSGFLLSLVVLAGSGVIASGRMPMLSQQNSA
jgi:membrane protein DedA with SNARE-associated domain